MFGHVVFSFLVSYQHKSVTRKLDLQFRTRKREARRVRPDHTDVRPMGPGVSGSGVRRLSGSGRSAAMIRGAACALQGAGRTLQDIMNASTEARMLAPEHHIGLCRLRRPAGLHDRCCGAGGLTGQDHAGDEPAGAVAGHPEGEHRSRVVPRVAVRGGTVSRPGPTESRSAVRRGDSNDDGEVDMSDAICILDRGFLGAEESPCLAAANPHGDTAVDVSDASWPLNFLLLGGSPLVAPYPDCGCAPVEEPVGCERPLPAKFFQGE